MDYGSSFKKKVLQGHLPFFILGHEPYIYLFQLWSINLYVTWAKVPYVVSFLTGRNIKLGVKKSNLSLPDTDMKL